MLVSNDENIDSSFDNLKYTDYSKCVVNYLISKELVNSSLSHLFHSKQAFLANASVCSAVHLSVFPSPGKDSEAPQGLVQWTFFDFPLAQTASVN